MSVPPTNPQDTEAAIAVLIAIGAIFCVFYWRMALRIIIILLLILTIYGAVAGFHGLSDLLNQPPATPPRH
jgi:hypothetical protein